MTRFIIALLVLSLSSVFTQAQSDLSDYRADISAVRYGTFNIRSEGYITFNHLDDEHWQLKIRFSDGPVKLSETTRGDIKDQTYRPTEFERRLKVLFYRESVDWDFNWQANRVTGQVKKDDHSYPLTQIIHDPNSFQVPMRRQLMQGATSFDFRFLGYRQPTDLKFEVIGEELLSLEGGRVHTLILKQLKPLGKDEKKLIWVARDHQFIPVKYANYEDGKIRDEMTVKKLWIDGKPVRFSQ